jgi:hypothetical protein
MPGVPRRQAAGSHGQDKQSAHPDHFATEIGREFERTAVEPQVRLPAVGADHSDVPDLGAQIVEPFMPRPVREFGRVRHGSRHKS